MKKTRFAIIGCGMISEVHASAVRGIENASLVGAWDIDSDRTAAFCKKYEIAQFPSFEAVLEDGTVDAVCICTPSVCHKDQAIRALESGKNVVLEKPMALTAEEAKRICDVCDTTERKLTVIFQTRFSEDVQYVKSLIDQKAFGKLCFCDLYMKFYRDRSYYSNSAWRGTLKYDGGGALMNQGIHGVDLMHYLVGEADLISGKVKTVVHNIETEDAAIAMLDYTCGALGVIEASTCSSPGFRRRVEINGENGYVILSDTSIEKLYLNGEMIISNEIDPHPSTANSPALASSDLHKVQIRNFINAINGKEELVVTPYDGYYAVKLIESIYNSSKNN